MEHLTLIAFKITKSQFRYPISDIFPPVIHVSMARGGDEANVNCFLN